MPFDPNGPISTLMGMGGSNWPGGAYDPETHMVYVTASVRREQHDDLPLIRKARPCRTASAPVQTAGPFGGLRDVSVRGLPLLKPPYGTIAAFDLTKGEKAWEIPNGETPANIKNHPALAGVNIGRTGRAGNRRARSRRRRC